LIDFLFFKFIPQALLGLRRKVADSPLSRGNYHK